MLGASRWLSYSATVAPECTVGPSYIAHQKRDAETPWAVRSKYNCSPSDPCPPHVRISAVIVTFVVLGYSDSLPFLYVGKHGIVCGVVFRFVYVDTGSIVATLLMCIEPQWL